MANRISSCKNPSATGFILKRSAAAPKPVMEVMAATQLPPLPPAQAQAQPQSRLLQPQPWLIDSRSTDHTSTQRNYSFSGDHNNQSLLAQLEKKPQPQTQPAALLRSQSSNVVPQRNHSFSGYQRQQSLPLLEKKPQAQSQAKGSYQSHNEGASLFPVCSNLKNNNSKDDGGSEGIRSSQHPQHKLIQMKHPNPFTCMGCKEYGAGICFTCQQCNFELHHFCALAPSLLKSHPLHSQHHLLFYPKPPGKGLLRSKCDVCGKAAKGYIYQCSACSFQIHPCCAMLSAKMRLPTHPQHIVVILPSNMEGDVQCAMCKRKRSGQVYRCTVCDYYVHAVCAKNMVNGLHAIGIKGGLDKPSMLTTAFKIGFQVVGGFMEGILEGIGEGLGEALTQNIAKGKCEAATTTTTTTTSNKPNIPTSNYHMSST